MNIPCVPILATAVVWAALAGPARAQAPSLNLLADTPSKTQDQVEQERARDKAYRESLRKIPDAKASNDPWGGVRNSETTTTKPAPKSRSKGSSASN